MPPNSDPARRRAGGGSAHIRHAGAATASVRRRFGNSSLRAASVVTTATEVCLPLKAPRNSGAAASIQPIELGNFIGRQNTAFNNPLFQSFQIGFEDPFYGADLPHLLECSSILLVEGVPCSQFAL